MLAFRHGIQITLLIYRVNFGYFNILIIRTIIYVKIFSTPFSKRMDGFNIIPDLVACRRVDPFSVIHSFSSYVVLPFFPTPTRRQQYLWLEIETEKTL